MLGSIDPVIIFQIYKKPPVPTAPAAKVNSPPLSNNSSSTAKITLAIVPIYLSESITGLYIQDESKNIDIDTNIESNSAGIAADITQKALASITTCNLVAKQGSIGLTILLALAEQILDKATSGDYEVTYMHGPVTVFGGLIHSFSYDQSNTDDLIKIKIEFSRGKPKKADLTVPNKSDGTTLMNQGPLPQSGAPTSPPSPGGGTGGGTSVIVPRT